MGRLTLNVLLSFAQFEREVAGERIRDKITLHRLTRPEMPADWQAQSRRAGIRPA